MIGGSCRVGVAGWEEFGWLRHGFSTRLGGVSTVYGQDDLNLGFTRDDDALLVAANRATFLEAVAPGAAGMVTVRQVHGTGVMRVEAGEGRILEADGMTTDAEGVMLGIQVADCVPVLVADVRRHVVAAFHAGWRGTATGIVERGIAQIRDDYGSEPGDLIAAIGPSIRACCYTVGDEVSGVFAERFSYAAELLTRRADGLRLDLAEANRRQLMEAGVSESRISVVQECTACARVEGRRKYFSHRAEKGKTGRAMGLIGIARG